MKKFIDKDGIHFILKAHKIKTMDASLLGKQIEIAKNRIVVSNSLEHFSVYIRLSFLEDDFVKDVFSVIFSFNKNQTK
jgi:hypothetical protein